MKRVWLVLSLGIWLVLSIVLVYVLALGSVAMAANFDPAPDKAATTTNSFTYEPTVIAQDGGSRWIFNDDTEGKREGAYRIFDATGTGLYTVNPHGGYSTTTNKCKTCHAVHRAQGPFRLLRGESQDDACNYCHIGSSLHSGKQAYGTVGIYTGNGHTIGSGPTIPDSANDDANAVGTTANAENTMWLATDADGNKVREYAATRNTIYRTVVERSGAFSQEGPLTLTCMSCHTVHNGTWLTWKPGNTAPLYESGQVFTGSSYAPNASYNYGFMNTDVPGYKLLRNNPDGKLSPNTATFKSLIAAGNITTNLPYFVPETTISNNNTGYPGAGGSTGTKYYTQYTAYDIDGTHSSAITAGKDLSVFCAGCHSLNIGIYRESHTEGGYAELHADRTHSVPYSSYECYSCHRTNLGANYRDSNYQVGNPTSDFPHSGAATSTKLLFDTYDASTEHIDEICISCHAYIGAIR